MGSDASRADRTSATIEFIVAGSPGPFERNSPSKPPASISSNVIVAGIKCTSIPRAAIFLGVADLIPRSIAATLNFLSPTAGIISTLSTVTSSARNAPAISGALLTLTTISSRESSLPEKIPTLIAPRSRK